MDHRIEVSPSGRATCKTCGKLIAKGELPLGEEYASSFGSEGVAIRWHHLMCGAGKLMNRMALVFCGCVVFVGCGAVHLKADYRSFGEYDPARDKEIVKRFEAEREKPMDSSSSVTVLIDTIPAGVKISGGTIKVKEGLEHKVLGRFSVGPDGGFFPNFRDGWRKGLCYWQVPLMVATLFVWAIVPTSYPCWTTLFNSKADIVTAVKRMTIASGGDVAIMSFMWDRDMDDAYGARGFILRLDPRMKGKKLETTPMPKKRASGPI